MKVFATRNMVLFVLSFCFWTVFIPGEALCSEHIGVYFDEDATNSHRDCATPNEEFSVYVVFSDLTHSSGIETFEFSYDLIVYVGAAESITRLETTFPSDAVNVGDSSNPMSGEYCVGFATPLIPAPVVSVLEWRFIVSDPEVRFGFQLGAFSDSSIPDSGQPVIAYADGVLAPASVVLHDFCDFNCIPIPCPLWCPPEALSALVGATGVVPVGKVTFDRVKSLYR